MVWSPDRLEQMLHLRRSGMSAKQIGEALGITRNSVIGKLHRMGDEAPTAPPSSLPASVAVRSQKAKGVVKGRQQKHSAFNFSFGSPERAAGTFPVITPPEDSMPDARAVGAAAVCALRPGDCRWPIGDPKEEGFRFCGSPRERGFAYCPHHHDAATQE